MSEIKLPRGSRFKRFFKRRKFALIASLHTRRREKEIENLTRRK